MGLLLALLSGAPAITGTTTTQQAAQTINVAGLETFTGPVAQTQAIQDITASSNLVFTGAATLIQAAQAAEVSGIEVFSGATTQNQAVQGIQGSAVFEFAGTGATQQSAQNTTALGQISGQAKRLRRRPAYKWTPVVVLEPQPQIVSGVVIALQAEQTAKGSGEIRPLEIAGDAVTGTKAQHMEAAGVLDLIRQRNKRLAILIALCEAA